MLPILSPAGSAADLPGTVANLACSLHSASKPAAPRAWWIYIQSREAFFAQHRAHTMMLEPKCGYTGGQGKQKKKTKNKKTERKDNTRVFSFNYLPVKKEKKNIFFTLVSIYQSLVGKKFVEWSCTSSPEPSTPLCSANHEEQGRILQPGQRPGRVVVTASFCWSTHTCLPSSPPSKEVGRCDHRRQGEVTAGPRKHAVNLAKPQSPAPIAHLGSGPPS